MMVSVSGDGDGIGNRCRLGQFKNLLRIMLNVDQHVRIRNCERDGDGDGLSLLRLSFHHVLHKRKRIISVVFICFSRGFHSLGKWIHLSRR